MVASARRIFLLLLVVSLFVTGATVFGGPESETFARAVGAVAVANVVLVVVQPFLRRATGKEPTTYRLRIVTTRDDERTEVAREVRAGDFASAVEAAIREVERDGREVLRVERISPATASGA